MEIRKLTQSDALEICHWHYDGIYSFYDMEADLEDYEAFIDEKRRSNHYSVFSDNLLIGYFNLEINKDIIEMGLGMKPEMTGKGFGHRFVNLIIEFIISNFSVQKMTLSVACFNHRTIKVYKKCGFIEKETFKQKTNGGIYDFLKMELIIK